jgi:hypothetical protein
MSTEAQIASAVAEAEKRILPARIAPGPANQFTVMAWLAKNPSLDQTQPETFVAAFKALLTQLTWKVKPNQLVLRENVNKPVAVENQREIEEARQAILKADERKKEIEKEFAALVKQCHELIESYHPRRKGGSLDYTEQADAQTKWRATLKQATEKNGLLWMRGYKDALVAAVEKRYSDREKVLERI